MELAPRVDAMLLAAHGPSVLDVGCAGGLEGNRPIVESPQWAHRYVHEAFDDVWGIDFDAPKIDFLQHHGYPNTRAADAQTFDLGLQFDTVLAGELIEHLPKPAEFLETAARHLKPGGEIVITTPYGQGLAHMIYAWLKYPRTCSNPEHMMWFCPATLTVLAESVGLQVTRVELIMDYPPRAPSRLYRLLRRALVIVAPLLPLRIKANTMLAVLRPPTPG